MNKNIAIQVENLSKAYQLGQIGTGTISRDLERFWTTKIRGKEDPFLKIGQTNDRTVKGDSDIVWSLKDINFEIEQGDAVGIIGRNGAGKSTLLKLLSRVTAPTTGNIKVKGRIASLLEVGTGFHPELTGRENIFLNGAILGMRKREIARKLDEIIDFSGVERYIDTPVKRYSSGMYVRLAFAVAAHLESEILIVDEVLAVGDAEFQKKCLGKMGQVSRGEGRTVLFVSHNLDAVEKLCNKAMILECGTVGHELSSEVSRLIMNYLYDGNRNASGIIKFDTSSKRINFIEFIQLKANRDIIKYSEEVNVLIRVNVDSPLTLTVSIETNKNQRLFCKDEVISKSGLYSLSLPANLLMAGEFQVGACLSRPMIEIIDLPDEKLKFEIVGMPEEFSAYTAIQRDKFEFGFVYLKNQIVFLNE
jgi:lipopolysaccharide transport system ATP-binding protein